MNMLRGAAVESQEKNKVEGDANQWGQEFFQIWFPFHDVS
jgi:hypothetical protein